MEDFYPLRSEDFPELVAFVQETFVDEDKWGMERKENAISFLLPLVIDLLDDVERIKSLKNTFLELYGASKISDGLLKIVEAYLEENNGTGNMLRITEVLRSNVALETAKNFEKMLLRYSLPASPEEGESVYSLSREFLQEKEVTAENSVSDPGVLSIYCYILDLVSDWNANSVQQALQNSVILEEIFKKLHVKEQKLFRLVSPAWLEETFSFWRRNARILIHVSAEQGSDHFGISLSKYMDLWKEHEAMHEETGKGKMTRGLQDNPFRSYRVSYELLYPFSCGQMENDFWKSCGQLVEDLEIIQNLEVHFKASTCRRLIQDICPNLKRLHIKCYDWEEKSSSESEEEEDSSESEEEETKQDDNKAAKSMKIAKNLHTLSLGNIDEESLRSVLFICPNLKTLDLYTGDKAIGALLSPTSTGEFIQLKKLRLSDRHAVDSDDFLSLRQYTEMLARNKFDSLEHLKLATELSIARDPPFNLYAALAHAGKNLKTLELELALSDGDDGEENSDWFVDLSPFTFPNLTELNLYFDYDDVDDDDFGNMKFDFGTLKGMPMLERLDIIVRNVKNKVFGSPGAQNVVFEGDRNMLLPTGVTVDQYSAENPILCSKLKEFLFDGWSLNEEDIRLLSSWFPNLTRLETEVSPEALPILLENWPQLEKLVIQTEKLISLRKLRPLKEKKKHVRIFQQFLEDRVVTDELFELREQNGWLFFSNAM